jgi:acetoin:2,6-dichlorophenolindophenol oxidoreductase subunit alpha
VTLFATGADTGGSNRDRQAFCAATPQQHLRRAKVATLTSSEHPANTVSPKTATALFRLMLQARAFERAAYDLFLEGLVAGTSHLAIGQEAIAAGFAFAMREDDLTFGTYRGHTHTLLRGASPAALMAELLGRATGSCGGRGGSMHLMDVSHHAMGSYAIVGAHIPIATGAAWAAMERGTGQVAVCFFGDGATNIGAFHEALNLATVWRVPVVFVCENNLYMEYTPIAAVTAVPNPAADRAASYGLERIIVDGNDVEAVHAIAQRTIERARMGEGPSLVEAKTYRHGGHSRADPGKYRPPEEVREWLARDPIPRYRARLLSIGVPETQVRALEDETAAWIERATAEARSAPAPEPESLDRQLWAAGDSAWRS